MALNNENIAKYIILDIGSERVDPEQQEERCIYKIHEVLRNENEDAFTPYLISIGPIHRHNAKLEQMEKQKLRYFEFFCQRYPSYDDGKEVLENFAAMIGNQELTIRRCYSESYPELDKKEFVRMITLDAVFIMELFLRNWNENGEHGKDDLFTISWVKKSIERDLLLAENQIPFFVLDMLYDLIPRHPNGEQTQPNGEHSNFLQLSRCYFEKYDPYPKKSIEQIDEEHLLRLRWKIPEHFTDLVRSFLLPQDLGHDGYTNPNIKNATKLKEAGISFEPVSNGCLLDVKFQKNEVLYWLSFLPPFRCSKCVRARLTIPKFTVDGSTESILRNLMAFELLHYPYHHFVCNYVSLFDRLIDTEKDADVLVESGVIVHELGRDKDLVRLFNKICKNIVVNSGCYNSLSRDLRKHCNPVNTALAELWLVYFKSPWRSTGTLVGIAVLAFAIAGFYKTIHDLLKHH